MRASGPPTAERARSRGASAPRCTRASGNRGCERRPARTALPHLRRGDHRRGTGVPRRHARASGDAGVGARGRRGGQRPHRGTAHRGGGRHQAAPPAERPALRCGDLQLATGRRGIGGVRGRGRGNGRACRQTARFSWYRERARRGRLRDHGLLLGLSRGFRNWKGVPAQAAVQLRGKNTFYERYEVRVAIVERGYKFPSL